MDVAAPELDTDDATEPRHIAVIFNPAAGRRRHRRLRATLRALAELGLTATVTETGGPGEAERIARHLASVERATVVVAGGDGTINEAVNGLLSAPDPLPALAVIPLGTANVLAHEIGLGTDPRTVARTIAVGRRLRVRPGRINGRHFMMMVGAGFDGAVVAGIAPAWKRRAGRMAYAMQTLIEAWRYPFPILGGAVDGRSFAARWVVVCRGRHYGGPFVVAPGADLADPVLSIRLLPGRGPWQVLRYGLALVTGRMDRLSDLVAERGARVRIDASAGISVQGDGDLVAHLPAEIDLAERAIELLVPPTMSR